MKGIVIAIAVRERPHTDMPGAFKGRCFDCKCEVWLSPSVRSFLLKGWRPICIACSPAYADQIGYRVETTAMRADLEARRHVYARRHGVDPEEVTESLHPGLLWTDFLGRGTPLFKAPV